MRLLSCRVGKESRELFENQVDNGSDALFQKRLKTVEFDLVAADVKCSMQFSLDQTQDALVLGQFFCQNLETGTVFDDVIDIVIELEKRKNCIQPVI